MLAQLITGMETGTRLPDLPERLREAVQGQQEKSEKLIGWIQLAVVAVFAALYIVSPKNFIPPEAIRPVPWVLSLYFIFTLLRLYLAHYHRLPGWFIALSVVADIALLLVTIWSFHLQYMQPPSFYLKAPTLLYIFIFIALRTLRFEARYVVLAGVVAAIGWALMFLYVIVAEPGNPMITRNYVEYLTSNSVLIGGEIDKIISIAMVTTILALAMSRGRALMIRSVAEAATTKTLSRFFSAEVIAEFTSGEADVALGQGVARDAAILMVDIRGFTRISEGLTPDQLIALVIEYQTLIVPIIRRHGGTIDRFEGDGIVASFGSVRDSATYARDALAAVDDMMAALGPWNAARRDAGAMEMRIGAAVTVGPIVFGIIGDVDRLEYTLLGDCVNLSAKLEKHTKAEDVRALATAEALVAAKAQGYAPPAPRGERKGRTVEGVDYPVDIVVLAE